VGKDSKQLQKKHRQHDHEIALSLDGTYFLLHNILSQETNNTGWEVHRTASQRILIGITEDCSPLFLQVQHPPENPVGGRR
jgi:hypothetical protein